MNNGTRPPMPRTIGGYACPADHDVGLEIFKAKLNPYIEAMVPPTRIGGDCTRYRFYVNENRYTIQTSFGKNAQEDTITVAAVPDAVKMSFENQLESRRG